MGANNDSQTLSGDSTTSDWIWAIYGKRMQLIYEAMLCVRLKAAYIKFKLMWSGHNIIILEISRFILF